MNTTQEFLTRKEVSDLLRLEVRTVDKYRLSGALPALKLTPGRSVRFRREDVMKLVRG